MNFIIKNGLIVESFEPVKIRKGDLYIEDGFIKKQGKGKIIDAGGRLVTPGLINLHHHFYSYFAKGIKLKKYSPKNFLDVLKELWWLLDKNLTKEDIYYSSIFSSYYSLKYGTTLVFDHHESQGYQLYSLDAIRKAVEETGLRAVLAYGSSDRYSKGFEGVIENERFLGELKRNPSRLVKAMVGLHASFTVNDSTLIKSIELAQNFSTGIHIHLLEDKADRTISLKKYRATPVKRLEAYGGLNSKTLLAHGVHLNPFEMETIKRFNSNLVVNPESNMNNSVGFIDFKRIDFDTGLGTDAMTSNMVMEVRNLMLLLKHKYANPSYGFNEAVRTLFVNNYKIVEKITGLKLGKLKEGYIADFVIWDYIPDTPLDRDNIFSHFIFGIINSLSYMTFVDGKVVYRGQDLQIERESIRFARKLWQRL